MADSVREYGQRINPNFDLAKTVKMCREAALRELYGDTEEYKMIDYESQVSAMDALVNELTIVTAKKLIEETETIGVQPEKLKAFCDLNESWRRANLR